MDKYFFLLDKELCSENCPCAMSDDMKKQYSDIPYLSKIVENYHIDKNGADKVSDCKNFEDISNKYNDQENIFFKSGKFRYKTFKNYMKYVEQKFHCTGSCSANYENEEGKQIRMGKYLFSGINKGIPKRKGCTFKVMKWLKKILISYGAFALVSGVLQIAVSGMALAEFSKNRNSIIDLSESKSPGESLISNKN